MTHLGLKFAKRNSIRHVAMRLRQMLRRWKIHARLSPAAAAASPPSDVPKGHVAVRVGPSHRRYVVRAAHVNHPAFRELLARAAEEYGFHNAGPISIPCDESDFEQILRYISPSPSPSPSPPKLAGFVGSPTSSSCCCCCHLSIRRAWPAEALPLLRGFADKSVDP